MLGKDNTPKPVALKPLKKKVDIVENWSAPVGKSSKAARYLKLKPVIQGDTIYTADSSGMVKAINKSNAKSIWSKQVGSGIVSGPAVNSDYIALGTNEATVILLDKSNGNQVWRSEVSGDALAKPVIANGKVIVKTIDGHLYGLNLKSGKKEWVSDHGAPNLILKASSNPVVIDRLALVGFSDGKLDAVDIETGAVLWQRGIAYASGASDVERLVENTPSLPLLLCHHSETAIITPTAKAAVNHFTACSARCD